MQKETNSIQNQQQKMSESSASSEQPARRSWHTPAFSAFIVDEAEQWDNGGHHHHCWNRWKCS